MKNLIGKALPCALVALMVALIIPVGARGQGGYEWSIVTPAPTTYWMFSFCDVAPDDIWAGGDNGTFLHNTGFGWSVVTSPGTNSVRGISAQYQDNIWAVGAKGMILRYSGEGVGWNPAASPAGSEELLDDVSILASGGTGWAVSQQGNIYYCNGSSWSFSAATPSPLYGVAALSSSDAWAVGGNGTLINLYHYNGSWSQYATTVTGTMLDIYAVAPDNIWACGTDSIGHAVLFHYDGSGWTSHVVEGCSLLWSIDARAADDIWAAGAGGKMIHYDGATWADASGITTREIAAVVSPVEGTVWGAALINTDQLEMIEGHSAAPVVSSISAPAATVGTELTLYGDHFASVRSGSTVKFNGVAAPASDYTGWSDDQIKVLLPREAKSGPVTVTTDFGTSNAVDLAVTPTVESISPSRGTRGTIVNVTNLAGTGFYGTPTVRLKKSGSSDINATSVTVVSSTKITCKIPIPANASAGAWNLLVRNPDGQSATKAGAFTVSAPPAPEGQHTWYLAEGSTAYGFDTYISIQNPNTTAVTAEVTYMTGSGAVNAPDVVLPPKSQATVNPRDKLGDQDFSTRVVCKEGKTISVDRTMSWTGEGASSPEAHSSVGVTAPAKTWYLPEGSTNWGFETWLLIQNPNAGEASCDVTYMIEGEGPKTINHSVPANSRKSFSMEQDIGSKDASIKVVSDRPVIPERAMYRNNRREGHDSIGTTSPASDFYLSEGEAADVIVTYMTPAGPKPQEPFTMEANSRKTIRVNDVLPNTDFSTKVTGTKPIIAERAMYWDNGTGEACHDSVGMASAHTSFFLPDGQTSKGRETYTLVQNPNSSPVVVEITYMTPDGRGNVVFEDTIPANSRQTYNMADKGIGGRASIMVTSKTTGKKIMCERAMYWNQRGAGTDTIGGFSD
jgi:IPT/TIG domain